MKKITSLTILVVMCVAILLSAGAAFATPWKFAVLCDSRSGYYNDPTPIVGPDGTVYSDPLLSPYYDATYGISPYFKNVAAALARETGIDFVLYPGDLVRGKKPVPSDAQMDLDFKEWLNQWQPVTAAGIPTYYVRGNHDAYANTSAAVANWTTDLPVISVTGNPVVQDASQIGLSYSFTHKGSLFVGLDEYPNGTGATGYDSTFLKAQLAKQAQHKFVFAHQPVWNYKSSELGPVGLADDMNNGGVDLYFSGHVHSYQRIAEKGYNFQEMIIGTGGAPQDNPTLGPGGTGYVADPNLTVLNYTGGAGTNARFGYAIITVNDDGTITTEMKLLDDPMSTTSTVTTFDSDTIASKPWKFAVMDDTQWIGTDDGLNPNTVAVGIIKQLNTEFINKGVKFVVQTGDLEDSYSANAMNTTAVFRQDLYNAGIGFWPLRGNHENNTAAAAQFPTVFNQTTGSMMNVMPSAVYSITNTDVSQPTPTLNGTPFYAGTISSMPVAPDATLGLDYAFDYNNARFVLLDQFVPATGTTTARSILDDPQVTWMDGQLSGRPANTHAFVYGHKHLISENHTDGLFGLPSDQPTRTNNFIHSLANNKVRIYMGGHDHMHNRAIVASPDNTASVQNIVMASDSSKFYIPYGTSGYTKRLVNSTTGAITTSGNLTAPDPLQTNDYIYNVLVNTAKGLCGTSVTCTPRETQIAQELNTVGYYIYTVDGPKVTVDYYSAVVNPTLSAGEYLISATPNWNTVTFAKRETFGYSLNGKEFLVAQGQSFTSVLDTHNTTTAAILGGTNNSNAKDSTGRAFVKTVDTGWTDKGTDTISDILSLWGMADLGAANTETFALSMSYDDAAFKVGEYGLCYKDRNGNWINAVNGNGGNSMPMFINGPYNPSYPLGAYGVDTAAKTVWAVINHNSDFAVASLGGTDVSAQISVASTGFVYSRATKLYTGKLTITNNGAAISTPVAVALSGLTSGVTLTNAIGSYNGAPYTTVANSGLAAGASMTVPLSFSNPSNAKINFTPVTFQE